MSNRIEIIDLKDVEKAVPIFFDFYSRKKLGYKIQEEFIAVFVELSAEDYVHSFKSVLKLVRTNTIHYIKLPLSLLAKLWIGELYINGTSSEQIYEMQELLVSDFNCSAYGVMNIGDIYKETFELDSLFYIDNQFLRSNAYFFSHKDGYVILPLSVVFKRFCCYDPIALKQFFTPNKSIESMGIFRSIEFEEGKIIIELERDINKDMLKLFAPYVHFPSFFNSISELQQRAFKEMHGDINNEASIFFSWPFGDSLTDVNFQGEYYNYLGKKLFFVYDIAEVTDEMIRKSIVVQGVKIERYYQETSENETKFKKSRIIKAGKNENPEETLKTGKSVSVDTDHRIPIASRVQRKYSSSLREIENKLIRKKIKPGNRVYDIQLKSGGGLGDDDKESETGDIKDVGDGEIPKQGLYSLFEVFVDKLRSTVDVQDYNIGDFIDINLIFTKPERDTFTVEETRMLYEHKHSLSEQQTDFCFMPIESAQKSTINKRKRRVSLVQIIASNKSCLVLEIEPHRGCSEKWYIISDGNEEDVKAFLLTYTKNFGGGDELNEFTSNYHKEIISCKHPIYKLKNIKKTKELDFSDEKINEYAEKMVERVLDYLKES